MSQTITIQPRPFGLVSAHASGLLMVMAAATLWATVGVASRLIPHELSIPDEAYGFARTAVAGPVLLLVALFGRGIRPVALQATSLPGFLTFGICCALFQIGLFRSFTLLGVTATVFITVCLPPVIAVAWTLRHNPAGVSRGVLSALGMAVAGLFAFSGAGLAGGGMTQVAAGVALSVMASLAFVVMSGAARRLAVDHPPVLVAGAGLTITSLFMALALLALSPAALPSVGSALSHWETSSFLLYLGLVPTALAYLLYCSGMARCRTAACGLVASMIEPAVAAGLAMLLLSEWLSAWEMAGCVLLFVAMLALWRGEQQSRTGDDAA